MSNNTLSSTATEAQKMKTTEKAVVSKCSRKITENGDATKEAALQNGTAIDDKLDDMFSDDMVNDMKQELANDAQKNVAENKDEFTDQCDQQDSEALEIKMKNSEKNEALQLFQQGKRNLLIEDYDAAVETLASACEKYTSIYGDLGAECGEVFMTYGHALVQLWRNEESNNKKEDEGLKSVSENVEGDKENGVAAESNDEEETAETNDEEETAETNDEEETAETNDEQAVAENSEVNEETAAKTATNDTDGEKTEVPAEGENSTGEVAQPKDDTIEDSAEENDDEDDCEEDEEVDNLQLAWEIFETAKTIYMKHNDELNLAKVYTKLGEISIASGNYELAIEDLRTGLRILKKYSSAKPRMLADTHFQLYTAYSAVYNFVHAELELINSKCVLDDELRILKGKLKDLAADSDEAKQITNEVKEFEKLSKDMQEKLTEFYASKRQVVSAISTTIMNKMENQKVTPSTGETTGSSGNRLPNPSECSSNVPVNNISHLVRKKPKNSEDEKPNIVANGVNGLKSNEDTPTEEVKESSVANGDSQICKRKVDDILDGTEPSAKKQCVS